MIITRAATAPSADAESGGRRNLAHIVRTAFSSASEGEAEPALHRRLRTQIQFFLACLIAVAVVSFALPVLPSVSRDPAAQQQTPPAELTGATLSYIRSNQDGTMPERIVIHIVSPTEAHVAKMVAPCTDAAYVTAIFDPATREATRLVGGRLTRESTQSPQAWVDLVPATRTLEVRLGDPASAPAETHPAPPAPWRIYDFDFGEFALFGPREPKDFTFGFALAWPDGTTPVLRIPGAVNAKFLYSSDNASKNHFRLSGPAFTDPVIGDRGGEIITDARTGHIIEARLGRPNHPGYANFMLKLIEATPPADGPKAWRDALVAHWANCPAEEPEN